MALGLSGRGWPARCCVAARACCARAAGLDVARRGTRALPRFLARARLTRMVLALRERRVGQPGAENQREQCAPEFSPQGHGKLHFLFGGIVGSNRLRQFRQRLKVGQHVVIFEHRQILVLHDLRILRHRWCWPCWWHPADGGRPTQWPAATWKRPPTREAPRPAMTTSSVSPARRRYARAAEHRTPADGSIIGSSSSKLPTERNSFTRTVQAGQAARCFSISRCSLCFQAAVDVSENPCFHSSTTHNILPFRALIFLPATRRVGPVQLAAFRMRGRATT